MRFAVPLGSGLSSAQHTAVSEVNIPYVCSVGPDADGPDNRLVGHNACP